MQRTRQDRQLSEIEAELELSHPRLAAMFMMFEELTGGEAPNGLERLPGRPRRRLAARRQEVVALVMLVMAAVLAVVFAVRPHPVSRQCHSASSSSAPRSPAGPLPASWPGAAAPGSGPDHASTAGLGTAGAGTAGVGTAGAGTATSPQCAGYVTGK